MHPAFFVPWFLIVYFLLIAALIVGDILFALAVYNDAKSLCNKDATMWAVLVGFLGLIPGIIYLCIRKSTGSRQPCCGNCRAPLMPGAPVCYRCGAQQPPYNPYAPIYHPDYPVLHNKAKNQLIGGIVCSVGGFVFFLIFFLVFATSMVSYMG